MQTLKTEDYEEILRLIRETLPENCEKNDLIGLERSFERFVYLTDVYQEQPQLLDPKLQEMIEILLNHVKIYLKNSSTDFVSDSSNLSSLLLLMKESFKYLCHLAKVRNPKAFLRRLPHDVDDLEPVVQILRQNETNNDQQLNSWEIRYICFLWLTLLCKLPFSFDLLNQTSTSIDNRFHGSNDVVTKDDDVIKLSLKDQLFQLGLNTAFSKADKSRDAACLFLSEFLSRSDVMKSSESYLKLTIDRCEQNLLDDGRQKIPALLLLCRIYQRLDRNHAIDEYAERLLQVLRSENLLIMKSDDILLRKLFTKFVQRLGLTMLKRQPIDWLYKKASKNLLSQITYVDSKIPITENSGENMQIRRSENSLNPSSTISHNYVEPPPKSVESIIDCLLRALKDKDTVVRWSAAKGLGRITCRLPRLLAKDVIDKLLTFFDHNESDAAWHGACLALAELGRRGCLLPDQLSHVIHQVTLALTFDQLRATYSIGAHVRDAACYACWSFARAFTADHLTPHVARLGGVLVTVALFDADLNCRRAASAAFQEYVGRLPGIFPHGLELIGVLDYFNVGSKSKCYKELSVQIAEYPEYKDFIVDHLLHHKLGHWDIQIRRLVAEAFYNLCKNLDENYSNNLIQSILPELITNSSQSDSSFLRHGSLLAIGQILKARPEDFSQKFADYFEQIKQLPEKLHQSGTTTGLGGEITCSALNHLLESLVSSENLKIIDQSMIESWFRIICKNLYIINCPTTVIDLDELQTEAAQTLKIYCDRLSPMLNPQFKRDIVDQFSNGIRMAKFEHERISASRGIGVSYPLLSSTIEIDNVISVLIDGSTDTKSDHVTWVAARSACLDALSLVTRELLVNNKKENFDREKYRSILITVINALDDYTTNTRGDVGVTVRKTAINSLVTLLSATPADLISEDLFKLAVCKLLQQCCSKIDTLSKQAVDACRILFTKSSSWLQCLPDYDQLISIFTDIQSNDNDVITIFQQLTPLLGSSDYAYHVTLGCVTAIGGLSESISQSASQALLTFLNQIHDDQSALDNFAQILIQISQEASKKTKLSQQLVLPLLKTLDIILSSTYFEAYENEANLSQIFDFVYVQCQKTKIQQKLTLGVSVSCQMLQFWGVHDKLCVKALKFTLDQLIHAFPFVRTKTAEHLYEALLTYGQLDNHSEPVLSMLTETDWANLSIDQLIEVKRTIADMLKISVNEENA